MSPYAATALAVVAEEIEIKDPPSAAIATSAMRCFIFILDIFFLSLVKARYFLVLARRSFDPLIPFPMAHTCNAARYGNLFIRWGLGHHLFDQELPSLMSLSQVERVIGTYDLKNLGQIFSPYS